MAIQVICPGCRSRFQVSDQFAGKKGPCPKCKTVIQIPSKSEEVVVHAPEDFGPKNSVGQAVFKPIKRTETKFTPLMGGIIGGSVLLALILALILRGAEGGPPAVILAIGAVLIGAPLAYASYSFLRDDELEPYDLQPALIRSAICGVGYALLWGIYAWLPGYFEIGQWELFQLVYVVPPLVLAGGGIALACFELDYVLCMVHYGIYLLVTILLCLIMQVPLIESGG